MFCSYCGKEIRNDAVFCPVCGKKLTPVAMRPAAQANEQARVNAADRQGRTQVDQQGRQVNPDVQAYEHQPEVAEQAAGTDCMALPLMESS